MHPLNGRHPFLCEPDDISYLMVIDISNQRGHKYDPDFQLGAALDRLKLGGCQCGAPDMTIDRIGDTVKLEKEISDAGIFHRLPEIGISCQADAVGVDLYVIETDFLRKSDNRWKVIPQRGFSAAELNRAIAERSRIVPNMRSMAFRSGSATDAVSDAAKQMGQCRSHLCVTSRMALQVCCLWVEQMPHLKGQL